MLFLALGCPYIDEAEVQARVDADGDGLEAMMWGGTDCDDSDPNIKGPGAFYVDADGDGHGSETITNVCVLAAGLSETSTDCNDTDNAVYPGVGERCATLGVDDDCDGLVDEADFDWVDGISSFEDADGDGVGARPTEVFGCTVAEGWVTTAGDCDDTEAERYPGAVELCVDGIDNDCDGDMDECSAGAFDTWIVPLEFGLGFGKLFAGSFDLDDDGMTDFALPAPYLAGAFIFSGHQIVRGQDVVAETSQWTYETYFPLGGSDLVVGAVEEIGRMGLVASSPGSDVPSGLFETLQVVDDAPSAGRFGPDWWFFSEEGEDVFGQSMDARDADGDGFLDVLVGAPRAAGDCGAAFLFYPPFGRDLNSADDFYSEVSAQRGIKFSGPCNGADSDDAFGATVAMLAEGGEHGAVAIGSPQSTGGDEYSGAVTVWRIDEADADTVEWMGTADAYIEGTEGYDLFGSALSTGDFNADGLTDLAVGAAYADGDLRDYGAAYLFHSAGTLGADVTRASEADVIVRGPDAALPAADSPMFGFAISMLGDMNADGYDDLAAGAPQERGLNDQRRGGAVWVCPGDTTLGERSASTSCTARINDEAGDFRYLGWAVEIIGSIDGDDRADLLVGEAGYEVDGFETGRVGIWFGADL